MKKKPATTAVQSFMDKLNSRSNTYQMANLNKSTTNRFATTKKLQDLRKKVNALEKKRTSLIADLKKVTSRLKAEMNDSQNIKSFKDIMNIRRQEIQKQKEDCSIIFKNRTKYSIHYPA